MCHLILAIPLLALPVFWLLPPSAAIPLYGAALAVSAGVYALAFQAMRRPVCTGTDALLHAVGVVREVRVKALTIWVNSELWSAEDSDEPVAVGDAVEVLAVDGLTLLVRKTAGSNDTRRATGGTGCPSHPIGEC